MADSTLDAGLDNPCSGCVGACAAVHIGLFFSPVSIHVKGQLQMFYA